MKCHICGRQIQSDRDIHHVPVRKKDGTRTLAIVCSCCLGIARTVEETC